MFEEVARLADAAEQIGFWWFCKEVLDFIEVMVIMPALIFAATYCFLRVARDW